jgi:hypothetical protein
LASLRQRIEELEKGTSALAQCDCCGKEIRSGNACVEFMRRVNKTAVDAKGKLTVTSVDDDILALICADCGNSYSDTASVRHKLGDKIGMSDRLPKLLSNRSAKDMEYRECDGCIENMKHSRSQTDLYVQIAQINRDANDVCYFTSIRSDNLFTFCHKCGYYFSRDFVEDEVRKMVKGIGTDFDEKPVPPDVGTEAKPVKIIDVGAEGGGITLFGWKDEKGVWHYLRETDERTFMHMMSENEQKGLRFNSKTDSTTDWDEAIKLMYRYPWPCLYPLHVHPEFADRVKCELKKAGERWDHIDFHHWDAVCAGKSRI